MEFLEWTTVIMWRFIEIEFDPPYVYKKHMRRYQLVHVGRSDFYMNYIHF